MNFLIFLIDIVIQAIILLLIAQAILSFFMSPFHPIRQFLSRLTEPILSPIRRILPQTGMIDFSPLVAIILLQVIDMLLTNLLRSL